MKNYKKKLLLFVFIIVIFIFTNTFSFSHHKIHNSIFNRTVLKFIKESKIKIKEVKFTKEWSWIELLYYDEQYPLAIDIVCSNETLPEKIIYMAGGGINFKSAFFTPIENNLSHFLRKNGYLVIGITPREENIGEVNSYEFMKEWGIEKHREDIRKVVNIIQSVVRLPYDMLGYSVAGNFVLDYASIYSDQLDKIIILDLESYDPNDTTQMYNLQLLYNATVQIMDQGIYYDDFIGELKALASIVQLYPMEDSGESREALGLPGNFTFLGLMHFSLIYSGTLPGFHTEITGLPGEWWSTSQFAGFYDFNYDPMEDNFGFYLTSFDRIIQGATNLGSGILPLAVWRDCAALDSFNNEYIINFNGIEEKVRWINSELGMGNYNYFTEIIKDTGNADVIATIVEGYGHVDLLWSDQAEKEVWPLLLE